MRDSVIMDGFPQEFLRLTCSETLQSRVPRLAGFAAESSAAPCGSGP